MKCAVCKREFGSGNACQHCGTDKVTALGNYNGYETPSNGKYDSSAVPVSQPKIVTVESMVCHACGEIIPTNSKYCPHCSQSLWVQCPKCGKTYSSQYPACGECGTNRKEYIEMQRRLAEKEKRRKQEEKRKQEIERKKHEEWLKSPEGQAEQKRKEKEREREGNRGCLIAIGYTIAGWGLGFGLLILLITPSGSRPPDDCGIVALIAIVVGLICMIGGCIIFRPRE